jgi:Cys-tRNA(Pro)/Cys-tRNA(Cys) deacylase
VYKTLVVEDAAGGRRAFLMMIPAESELNLKQAAAELHLKKVRMASLQDAEKRTGLKAGGISALALLNRGFDIYLANQAAELEWIVISAGKRGINLRLSVADLMKITGAAWLDCC